MAQPTLDSQDDDEDEQTADTADAEPAEETVDEPADTGEEEEPLFDGVEEPQEDIEETEDGEVEVSEGGADDLPDDPDEQLVELDEEEAGMFDGVEASDSEDDEEEEDDDEAANPFGEGDELDAGVGGIVIETAAEAACLGLDDEEREDLQPQYESIFRTMRLGYFTQRVFEERIMAGGDKDIDPVWGLVASSLICGAVAVWMRPDRDKHIETVKNVFAGDSE